MFFSAGGVVIRVACGKVRVERGSIWISPQHCLVKTYSIRSAVINNIAIAIAIIISIVVVVVVIAVVRSVIVVWIMRTATVTVQRAVGDEAGGVVLVLSKVKTVLVSREGIVPTVGYLLSIYAVKVRRHNLENVIFFWFLYTKI